MVETLKNIAILVEDTPAEAEKMKKELEAKGYTVMHALSEDGGIGLVQKYAHDAILVCLDGNMPLNNTPESWNGSGFKVAQAAVEAGIEEWKIVSIADVQKYGPGRDMTKMGILYVGKNLSGVPTAKERNAQIQENKRRNQQSAISSEAPKVNNFMGGTIIEARQDYYGGNYGMGDN